MSRFPPQKIGPRWVARSKISFSIEIFSLDRNLEFFWSLSPLGYPRDAPGAFPPPNSFIWSFFIGFCSPYDFLRWPETLEKQGSRPNMNGRRFHRTMEMIPARPWWSKSPSVSTPIKQSTKQGNARGTSEVRRGASSIHFHCPAPRSSGHIGHGKAEKKCRKGALKNSLRN